MMELRKKGKEAHQETKLSVRNPTNEATFRKLTAVYNLMRRKTNPLTC
jgi:hypothetical protein